MNGLGKEMKITIIGAGHIGGALALGLAAGRPDAGDITVTARHKKSLQRFKAAGLRTSLDNRAAVAEADVVFLAVKPWQMQAVAEEIAPVLFARRRIVASVAPGIRAEQYFSWFGPEDFSLSYVIPNTAAAIGESMTYIAPVTATEAETAVLKTLLDRAGKTQIVPPAKMLAGTSTASCGIAYALRYISASKAGAERLGLTPEEAEEAVCQTVRGAAALVAAGGTDAETEIDKVTTPGGLTLRGLAAMEDGGFSEAVGAGLAAAIAPKRRRLVVKVGSNVLTRADGTLDTTRVSAIVDEIVAARKAGWDIVLVTSGAVACGRSLIRQDRKLDEVQQRQLYSAIGQVRLMDLYYKLFIDYGINVGQILTMKKHFSGKREYANQRGCMEVMLRSGVVPIVNENDTVSITELMFTDNDELSGLVAAMVGAETLILLTNVDGLYTGAPDDPASTLVSRVLPGEDLAACISPGKSGAGRGGMVSKYRTALRTAAEGIRVLIANGKRDHILTGLLTDPEHTVHTEFIPG